MATEVCEFKMHPNMIYDFIDRQAGKLTKALLEAIMNSIEACDSPERAVVDIGFEVKDDGAFEVGAMLSVADNGRGIRDRKEVDDFFLHFGNPHSANETVIWKQFRMGRGQIFSYGKNTWRTSTLQMKVDIAETKAEGVLPRCEIKTGLPLISGCVIEIELYRNPIGHTYNSVEALIDEIRRQIEFMPGVIRFNGVQLNTPPEHLKWTAQDADAWYMFGKGSNLKVYNLGAYVQDISATDSGVTGVIVSKKMLKVNFARNAVQEDSCPVWANIRAVIRANRVKKIRAAARRLNGDERTSTLADIRDKEVTLDEVKTPGLFETTNDRLLRLDDIRKNTLPWTFAEKGDRLADKWLQSGQALCLDEAVLDALSYRGERKDFFYWLISRNDKWAAGNWAGVAALYCDFDQLEAKHGGDRSTSIIPHEKLTKLERRLLRVLEGLNLWGGRRIVIGLSGSAYLAWTDGSSYIALNRDYLAKLSFTGSWGPGDLMHTMMHEMSHDEDTSGTHHHGEEFYRRFHEITYRMPGKGYCPLGEIGTLGYRMKRAASDEVQEAAERKEAAAKAAVEKALGKHKAEERIAQAARVEAVPTDSTETDVAPAPVRVQKVAKSRHRRPLGLDVD